MLINAVPSLFVLIALVIPGTVSFNLAAHSSTANPSVPLAFASPSKHTFPKLNTHLKSKAKTRTKDDNGEGSTTDAPSISARRLEGCVCLVTGASRGIGKGIALELGKEGATVYVTGTSTSSPTTSPTTSSSSSRYTTNEEVGGPGTIEETAHEISQFGGKGIAVVCDHSNDEQVQKLFDQIDNNEGRLDILINNAFRVPAGKVLDGDFWTQGADVWDAMHTIGLRSHYIATCFAIPIMKRNPRFIDTKKGISRPFIGMVSSFGGLMYTFNVAYGVGKAAVDRLVKDMSVELEKENIAVCSFWPGIVMTERMIQKVENGEWEEEVGIPIDNSETPAYTGKAIIAIATDGETNMKKSGSVQIVAEVATEYGFLEDNGSQPPSIRSLKFLIPGYALDEKTRKKVPDWCIPDWKLPLWLMAGGKPPVNN